MRSKLYEGQILRPSARTLWDIQVFALKPPVEVATNLYTYVRDRADSCIRRSAEARAAITDSAAKPILVGDVLCASSSAGCSCLLSGGR